MPEIVTSEEALRASCEPVKDRKEGGEIARLLWDALANFNRKVVKGWGLGLSAPQIGIHKRVCVIHAYPDSSLWVLMNPVIVAASTTLFPYREGCISFPGRAEETERHLWVEVDTLNLGRLSFGVRDPDHHDRHSLLEGVVVQHEVDHLNSVLFFDRACKKETENVPAHANRGEVRRSRML